MGLFTEGTPGSEWIKENSFIIQVRNERRKDQTEWRV
jgi:hypothetical protein